ncbi:electron transfer flavoprotein subunit alpha/FixB family protein [Megasphaera paucivorans]|uniref:Electron transfer flavoprotein alpha subunit apoprotein n=1 Tax=Megasphaera paucivorans TaxID=349095 RepID=A0A1G9UI37_9FIRM|nr:electron transfer flavoprotein subunit alpha/FixB family protein [Megasphaera paucivorans]SDM59566.1 electron transfer flavoprotein alpha subunit apoprotein [Megasphaera paucivorans]
MEMKNSVWVYIELSNGKPSQVSQELLGKGRELADSRKVPLTAVLIGDGIESASKCVIGYGADVAIIVENPSLKDFNADFYAEAMAGIIQKYEPNVILIGASHNGRDIGGRLSAMLNLGLVADCIDARYEGDGDAVTWIRPAYTGKLFVKILTTTRPQLATISDKIFHGNSFDGQRPGEIIKETVDLSNRQIMQKVTDFVLTPLEEKALTLETADIVVGAGRGVGDEAGLKKVTEFAASIGAALGVSKPLVDNGWAPYELQVGITGKKIAPKIYIALGISGAIQHQLGIKEAGLIIAVNKDPDAPIFKFAHYGIVGDLFNAMPIIKEELEKLK